MISLFIKKKLNKWKRNKTVENFTLKSSFFYIFFLKFIIQLFLPFIWYLRSNLQFSFLCISLCEFLRYLFDKKNRKRSFVALGKEVKQGIEERTSQRNKNKAEFNVLVILLSFQEAHRLYKEQSLANQRLVSLRFTT